MKERGEAGGDPTNNGTYVSREETVRKTPNGNWSWKETQLSLSLSPD